MSTAAASGLDVVSLFAGVGGIDLAAERAGMRTRLLCEINEPCHPVLAAHFPDAVIHPDVTELTADDLYRAGAVPERTVVAAGFPCQDLSVAGSRRGMGEGTRSGLYWHVDRLLGEFRPAWVLLENVPGLLSAACVCRGDESCIANSRDTDALGCGEWRRVDVDGHKRRIWFAHVQHGVPGGACYGGCIPTHGGVMGAVLGSLAERGYGFAYRVLDARYFGVPQRRRRVVIVGHLGDPGAAPAEVLLEPEGVRRDSSEGGEAGPRIAGRARGSVAVRGVDIQNGILTDDMACTLTRPSGGANRIPHVMGVLGEQSHALTAEGADASEDGTGRGTPVIAFHVTQDPISGDISPAMSTGNATGCATIGVAYMPASAATLTAGLAKPGVSAPGRRQEDDTNLIAYAPDVAHSLMSPGGNDKHDPTMMTYVAFAENQRGEVVTSPTVGALKTGGGKPGQGYPAIAFAWQAGGNNSSSGAFNDDGTTPTLPRSQTLAVALRGTEKAHALVEDEVRRLTPLECERLQGLPDGWTDVPGTSDSQRYKQLGNSVAVPVFEWTLSRLAAVHAHITEAAA